MSLLLKAKKKTAKALLPVFTRPKNRDDGQGEAAAPAQVHSIGKSQSTEQIQSTGQAEPIGQVPLAERVQSARQAHSIKGHQSTEHSATAQKVESNAQAQLNPQDLSGKQAQLGGQPMINDNTESKDDTSQDTWAQAVKLVCKREKDLMADYCKHLGESEDAPVSLAAPQSVELVVKRLLREREGKQWHVAPFRNDIKIREQGEKLVKFFIWSDKIVSATVSSQPYAALAWTAVSILLPLLSSGITQQDAMIEGFQSICSVQIYWKSFENDYSNESQSKHIPQELREGLVVLFSHIIEYQARVICHLSKRQLPRTWEKLKGSNDWTQKVTAIKSLSTDYSSYIPNTRQREIRANSDNQLKEIEESREILDKTRYLLEENGFQMRRQYEDQLQRALLQDLPSDYETFKNEVSERVENTCQWFLKAKDFHDWRTYDKSKFLWVSAGPGCGKSVLSRYLIDDHQLSTSVTTSIVCYFFFKDGIEGRMDATNALSAILHQLFVHDLTGSLIEQALSSHRAYGKSLTHNLDELWRILTRCAETSNSGEIICVVDALDECSEPSRKKLIRKLNEFYDTEQHQSPSRLKFLVTGRPYDTIERAFRGVTSATTSLRLEGHENSDKIKAEIRAEIDLFIDSKVDELSGSLKPETREKISGRLKKMDNRTYLWLKIIFEIIENQPSLYEKESDINKLLSELPSEVSDAYEAILTRSPDPSRAKALLQIVLAARRPLSLDEMNVALTVALREESFASYGALEEGMWQKENFKRVVQNTCGLFISVHNSRIFFMHQTAREFLIDPRRRTKWEGSLNLKDSHRTLSLCCTRYLLILAKFAEADLELNGSFWLELEDECPQFPFYIYAFLNWELHLESHSPSRNDVTCKDARVFCHELKLREDLYTSVFRRRLQPTYEMNEISMVSDLTIAIYLGLVSVVDYILTFERVDVNAQVHVDHDRFRSALGLAARLGRIDVMHVLLDKGDVVQVTEDGLIAAASNRRNGGALMRLLLDRRGNDIQITERIVRKAAANEVSGVAVISLLLARRGNDFRITERIVEEAVANSGVGREMISLLLERRGNDFQITEEIIEKAVAKGESGAAIIPLLLERCHSDFRITEEMIVKAKTRFHSDVPMLLLLDDRCGDRIKITEDILVAAASNQSSGDRIMTLLLEKHGSRIQINKNVILAAASNIDKAIMTVLLEKRKEEIKVDDDVLYTVVENLYTGKDLMALFFSQCADQVHITQDLLEAAARLGHPSLLELLLNERGDEISVTENVVMAAADNFQAQEMLEVLILMGGDRLKMIGNILKTFVSSEDPDLITLLFGKYGDQITVTEDIFLASEDAEVRNRLLEEGGDKLNLTQNVMDGTARLCSTDGMKLLLEKRNDQTMITENTVMAAAAQNSVEMVELLLEKGEGRLNVTETILEAAAANESYGTQLTKWLFEKSGNNMNVTENIMRAAAGNRNFGSDLTKWVFENGGDGLNVTEPILEAAAENLTYGVDLTRWLLENGGDRVNVTEDIVRAAANNHEQGGGVIELLVKKYGDQVRIPWELSGEFEIRKWRDKAGWKETERFFDD